jgi:hypothetical protein
MGTVLMLMLAAAPNAHLVYAVGPGLEGCPDERWVRAAVAARIGRDPFVDDAQTTVSVQLNRASGAGLLALVEVTRPDGRVGRRSLESPTGDCLELASAVELAVSLALDPASRRAPAVDAGAPVQPEPVDAGVPLVVEPPPVVDAGVPPAPAPAPSTVVFGRLGALGTAGALPGFSGGLVLGGGVRFTRFSLAVEGRVHLPTRVFAGASVTTTFQALGSLVPCLEAGRFSGCLVASVGPFQFDDGASRATSVMALGGARASVRFNPWESFSFVPWLEADVVLTRTTLLRNGVPLWVSWPLAVSGGLTMELHFSS